MSCYQSVLVLASFVLHKIVIYDICRIVFAAGLYIRALLLAPIG
jgi:hypothetical protein